MGKIDTKFRTESGQCSVGCVQQRICGCIIRRSEPFALEYPPQYFCDIQVWAIWWQEKEEKASFFPYVSELGNEFAAMDAGIVRNNKGILPDAEGETFKEISDLVGCDALGRTEALVTVASVNHAENC